MNANLLISVVQFVGAIATLIIIHELGHFTVARLFKIDVEEFGLGIPPRMLTLFYYRGTRYSLNWLPLGGFVRIKGETDPTVAGGLMTANPWVRLGVYLAGPMANLLVGVLLYAIVFTRVGVPITQKVELSGLAPNGPAEMAGLQVGDLILKVNDQPINGMDAMRNAIAENLDKPTQITYQRGAEINTITLVPRSHPPEGEGAIGILMGNPYQQVNLIQAIPTGVSAVYDHTRALLQLPVQLARGAISPEQSRLVGYKGMFDIYQEVRQGDALPGTPAGVGVLLFFTNITISLGILNLLPVPALDGGRIFFTLPELVLRRRIPPEYENIINLISFAALLALLIYVNLQDFINPIQLPKP
jgi:regulator of sigma E protease